MKKIGGRVREEVHDSSMIRGGISEVIIEGVFMLVAGFFRLPNDLPKIIWRYPMSYMSFDYWALQVCLHTLRSFY